MIVSTILADKGREVVTIAPGATFMATPATPP